VLFYQGQWQFVLHPVTSTSAQPPVAAASAEFVRFAPNESAVPQLTGWWIPAAPGATHAQATILYLPSGDESVAASSTLLTALHGIGINVFAFDYRGYGQSIPTHPSQRNMTQDSESAWRYLHAFRDIADDKIVPYGVGVGTSLATHLAVSHPASLGVILESPRADLLETVRHDRRVRILPVRLLFHDDFPLAATLSILHTSKLLLSVGEAPPVFQEAADPKITVEFRPALGPFYTQSAFSEAVSRFLDQSLPPPPPPRLVLTPRTTPAPPRSAK